MKKILIKAGLVCLVAVTTFSCSKKIDDAYLNPNAELKVAPETLLPGIISSMAANGAGHGTMPDIRYIGQYIQNFSFYSTQSVFGRHGYNNGAGDVAQSTWRMHYYDIGQNNQRMMQLAAEDGKWGYVGAGKAIEAWSWLILTDYYDNVPLKEAFDVNRVTFKYDTQPEVYEHVKKLAHQAIENFGKIQGNVDQELAKGDAYFYNGDVTKWKKFTYGILARVHHRYTNKAEYKADSVIYYARLAMLDNTDDAMVKFQATNLSATNNYFGPFRANFGGTVNTNPTGIRQAEYIANLVNGTNPALGGTVDPRGIYMLRLNSNGTIKGAHPITGQPSTAKDRPENFHGISQEAGADNGTGTGGKGINPRYIFQNNAPFPLMTASEMHFLIAEAAFRKGDKAAALTAYKEGIKENFDMLTTTYNQNIPTGKEITTATRDAYLNDTDIVPTSAAGLTLSKIMLQKYIALFGWGVLETWVDMRRYHYIDLDPSGTGQVYAGFTPPTSGDLFPDNSGELVYRYYPRYNSEYVWNILELQRIGATQLNYHSNPSQKIWFALP